ncbi:hypothetical protein [Mesoflavibacter sp.]|uniref:hypothetical protein n=1 Tax=Mesoflavibacter sp. TaxID=1930902 RepID=UPI003519150D
MKYLRLFFLMIFLSSCNDEIKKTTSDFKTISIKSGPKNQHVDSARFRNLVEGNIKRYEYKTFENDSTFHQFIEKEIENDSVLIVAGTNCKLISSHNYQFNSEEIKIQAYLYNIPNLSDDESIFYFNNKYGVIAEYSLAWPDTKVLYNQEELKPLQDSIHKVFNRFLLIDKMVKMSKD